MNLPPQGKVALHRSGAGAPLVLLHALGSSSHFWEPVLPALTERFEVIAVDLPGFGASHGLAPPLRPTPAALAAAVAAALDEAGVHGAHVVGNSIGGWVALELARLRPLASLTLLSPAGMWPRNTPWYCRLSLRGTRLVTRYLPGVLDRLVEYRAGRVVLLGQTHGHPTRVSPDEARAAIRASGTCAGFTATLRATTRLRYERPREGADRFPPTFVAFGSRDLILLRRRWRRTDQLPADVVVRELPGCGHLPMSDDPDAVAALIVASTSAAVPVSQSPST
jgi:pimeloyl-ACP methyl ester carboxylesterase